MKTEKIFFLEIKSRFICEERVIEPTNCYFILTSQKGNGWEIVSFFGNLSFFYILGGLNGATVYCTLWKSSHYIQGWMDLFSWVGGGDDGRAY